MLSQVPAPFQVRYLLPRQQDAGLSTVDEIGYLFRPADYDYAFDNYLQEFSHKSAKRLRRELQAFENRKLAFRYDNAADFEILVEMNLDRFGRSSYFYDERFRDSVRDLMHFLKHKGWWRMTTVLVAGEVAAVDLGCIYQGVYTLLAGGTNANFPGIAKLINVHHMRFACERRLWQADFLCGNFSWKTLFHLTPRPLYLLASEQATSDVVNGAMAGRVADVA
jgi:CelD/BcsL family acetyltransferase involved in cellulose biosynthesis